MKRRYLYRKVGARANLDIFLVSAVASLLGVRFFLSLTGYPQLGGDGLHIAHMLWGGLLMMASVVILLSFLGRQAQRLAAFVGGAGFGVFIDEIGKFITSDNDYFFRPAIGIIYAIFVALYLAFSFLARSQRLSSREYQLNTLVQLEEAILHDMDVSEKRRAHELLAQASQRSTVTKQLSKLLNSVDLIPQSHPPLLTRWLHYVDQQYSRFWQARTSRPLIRVFFIAEAVLFVLAIGLSNYSSLDDIHQLFSGTISYGSWLLVGQFASSLIAASFVVFGVVQLQFSRLQAFENFRRATLINVFLTEFFLFSRIQFAALPGLLFNLLILLFIGYVMSQERRQLA